MACVACKCSPHRAPILDVKPYLRHDLHEDARVPTWCERPTDASMIAEVRFAPSAALALDRLAPRMRFYSDAELAREAIEQMLRLDIRSVHQGRGQAVGDAAGQSYTCRLITSCSASAPLTRTSR